MTAVLLTKHGGLDSLVVDECFPLPVPEAGWVRVRVKACSLNNTDINTRVGWYSSDSSTNGAWSSALKFPLVQGADVAGVVELCGPGVDEESLRGQRVLLDPWVLDETVGKDPTYGYLGSELNGGYATHLIVPARNVHVISPLCPLSFFELSSFPTAAGTALDMVKRSGLSARQTVLVTGSSGGVGGYAVQLCRLLGAFVIASCDLSKSAGVVGFGADLVVDRNADLEKQLAESGHWRKVDVVLDVVGGEVFPTIVGALKTGGKYVVSGAIGGPIVQLDLRVLYLRDLTLVGATLTSPETFKELVRIIQEGGIKPAVAATFPLRLIKEAQQTFIDKKLAGKIVLDCE